MLHCNELAGVRILSVACVLIVHRPMLGKSALSHIATSRKDSALSRPLSSVALVTGYIWFVYSKKAFD